MKLLLDTDIGSDIDDALCLAYLLAQPACELLGITTVTGEPVERAKLASALCRAAGRDVPIFPGAAEPLLIPQRQPTVPQAAALARWPHATDFPSGAAVEFMRQTIRQHPGEVTLLAIGPMTNVALLFRTDPEIAGLLKGLVMMIGVFTDRLAGVGPLEWNALCDPHAAAIVYQTSVPVHRSVGLDVTCQVTMDAQAVRERFQTPRLRPVLDFAEVWFRERQTITFHDPLAAVSLFAPGVCSFERGRVNVELNSSQLAGHTAWQPDAEQGPHEVALDVEPDGFFQAFFESLTEKS